MSRVTRGRWCQRIVEGGWLLIALAVPLAFDAGSAQPFEPAKVAVLRTVVLFMVACCVTRQASYVRRGLDVSRLTFDVSRLTNRSFPLILALALAVLYLAATVFSISPRLSFWGSYQWRQGTYTFLCLLALFALVAGRLRTRPQRDRLVTAMLYASAVVSGYGLLQFAGLDPIPWERSGERAFATLGHPNFLGLYLAMTMPLTVARLLGTPGGPVRGFYAGLLLAQAGCLLATVSRSAWLGALVAGVVFVLLLGSRARRARWATGGLGAAAVILLTLAALAYADPGGWASGGPLEPVHSLLRGKSATTAIRVLEWPATAQIVAAHPALGTGPESFALAFQAVYPPALTAYGGAGATGGRAHNEFLDWVVNAGLLGLAAYLALVLVVCWRGWRVGQRAPRDEALLAAALIAGVAAYLVANQFSFGTAATLSALWLSLGLLAAWPYTVEAGLAPAQGDREGRPYASLMYEIVAHAQGAPPLRGTKTLPLDRQIQRTGGGSGDPPRTGVIFERAGRWGRGLAGAALFLTALAVAFGTNVVPLLADAHAKTGLHRLTAGDWPAAIVAYEQAIALQPDQDHYHALLASAHLAWAVNGTVSSFPQAEAASERAIALSPVNEAYWLMLGDVRRYWGEAIAAPTLLDRAIAAYREAQRLSPTDPEPPVKMGQVLMLQGRPAEAVFAYQAALALDPLNVSAYTHLALAYEALGRPADAAEARRQAARAADEIDRLIAKR